VLPAYPSSTQSLQPTKGAGTDQAARVIELPA
jgi:hypothetical protein